MLFQFPFSGSKLIKPPPQRRSSLMSAGANPVERHEQDPAELKENYRKLIPLGRWGVPEDVAGAVVFLASQAASFITGQNLHINGGTTVH
jgi:NAD(P)-dependent dehydrogenase (short-subunit alcohol dehydrogenase family)